MSPNVNIPFRDDATEASLVPDPLGWCLVSISATGREPIIASRTDVAEAVLNQSPRKRAHIPDCFEDRIRAAGYGSSRMIQCRVHRGLVPLAAKPLSVTIAVAAFRAPAEHQPVDVAGPGGNNSPGLGVPGTPITTNCKGTTGPPDWRWCSEADPRQQVSISRR